MGEHEEPPMREVLAAIVQAINAKTDHPVKDIVIPLAVVIGLVGNALYVGSWGGRTGQRLDTIDGTLSTQGTRIEKLADDFGEVKEKLHDLTRDVAEYRRDFLKLEDYARGRIDRLPYHAPPTARR